MQIQYDNMGHISLLYLADVLEIFVKFNFAKSKNKEIFFFPLLNLIFDKEIRVRFSYLFAEVSAFSSYHKVGQISFTL